MANEYSNRSDFPSASTTDGLRILSPRGAMRAGAPPNQPRRVAPLLLVLLLAGLGAYLFWRGHGFYGQSVEGRLDHPEYKLLRPSGFVGHGYGVVGTVLILTNLLYLLRRRLAFLSLGSLRRWLDVHVVAGLAGATLIVFHSAFQLRTAIATTTAVSLGVLVLTGVIGLYIYRLLPKPGLLHLHERLGEVEPLLPKFARNAKALVEQVPCTSLPANTSLVRALLTVPRWSGEARARRKAVARAAQEDEALQVLARKERRVMRDLVSELSDLAAREVDTHAAAALMRSWRSLHGFMAILMVLCVVVHIGVAWVYGYRWMLSE
jgi:hypothetical protein